MSWRQRRCYRGPQTPARPRAADLAELLTPSRARALALDKAYRAVVREQSYTRGREAVLSPAVNVHAHVDPERTPTAGAVHLDGLALTRRPG